MNTNQDTIAAIATPPGRGGVGIVRVSGAKVRTMAKNILGKLPKTRLATFCFFRDGDGEDIDAGIALFFAAPSSMTGEDVLELHAHGGPVILDRLLSEVFRLGARQAEAGEFTQRAFLNDKIDLVQAEAVADLIDSGSQEAAQAALRSLQGLFSERVHALADGVLSLRVYVEAALDFPDEEIEDIAFPEIERRVLRLEKDFAELKKDADQAVRLREGLRVAIVGKPNAGKSTLLNALAGEPLAIVSEIPGTTRDVIRETIYVNGAPIHIVDTAGLRDSDDAVEQEGVRRAHAAMTDADLVFLVVDSSAPAQHQENWQAQRDALSLPAQTKVVVLLNKCDLLDETDMAFTASTAVASAVGTMEAMAQAFSAVTNFPAMSTARADHPATEALFLSAKTGAGLEDVRVLLSRHMGLNNDQRSALSARRRHLDALDRAEQALTTGFSAFFEHRALELFAEELRAAHGALGTITGTVTSDDLLGEIFSQFCIGK